MIRLALAVGFLAVFGIVTFAVVVLLTHYFSNKSKQNQKEVEHDNARKHDEFLN